MNMAISGESHQKSTGRTSTRSSFDLTFTFLHFFVIVFCVFLLFLANNVHHYADNLMSHAYMPTLHAKDEGDEEGDGGNETDERGDEGGNEERDEKGDKGDEDEEEEDKE